MSKFRHLTQSMLYTHIRISHNGNAIQTDMPYTIQIWYNADRIAQRTRTQVLRRERKEQLCELSKQMMYVVQHFGVGENENFDAILN